MTLAGRVLAIDPGEARIGVAVSDPLGITAQPIGFVARRGEARDLEAIRGLVSQHEAVRVVVGHPLRLSGEAGEAARRAGALADRLREALGGTPVELWDERLTTAQAERALLEGDVRRNRRRRAVDAIAAALILQSWLDARQATQRSSST